MRILYNLKNLQCYNNGIFKIPKNCINADFGRFKEVLFMEYSERSKRTTIIKSAIVSWFGEINKGKDFSINMNGYESIILQCENKEVDEFYLDRYHIIKEYLVRIDDYSDLIKARILLERKEKIENIKSSLCSNQVNL